MGSSSKKEDKHEKRGAEGEKEKQKKQKKKSKSSSSSKRKEKRRRDEEEEAEGEEEKAAGLEVWNRGRRVERGSERLRKGIDGLRWCCRHGRGMTWL